MLINLNHNNRHNYNHNNDDYHNSQYILVSILISLLVSILVSILVSLLVSTLVSVLSIPVRLADYIDSLIKVALPRRAHATLVVGEHRVHGAMHGAESKCIAPCLFGA